MNAHQLNAFDVIINTIVVDSLDALPDSVLVDADIGGSIGDSIVEGVLIPKPIVQIVPQTVSMRQARLALLGAGRLDAVTAAIAAMTGPSGQAAQIEWEYSQEVWRNKALVLALGPTLGLSSEQLDDLFITASQID